MKYLFHILIFILILFTVMCRDDVKESSKDESELSKCESFGGTCETSAICGSGYFPWYAWGCSEGDPSYTNCCLPETSSCTGLGGQCWTIDNINSCHALGWKAANAMDCPGSPLTTICCMPPE